MNIGLPENISNKVNNLSALKNNKTRYSLFELVLVLIILFLFFWFLVKPKMADQGALRVNLNNTQTEADELSSNLEKLKNLIDTLKKSTTQAQKLDEALPLEFSSARTTLLINSLAESSGVVVGQLDVASKTDETVAGNKALLQSPFSVDRNLQKVNVSLHVIGTYEQLKTFLQKIESNSRVMDINILELAGNNDGQLDLKVNLYLYYYSPSIQ